MGLNDYDWTLKHAFQKWHQTGISPWCSTESTIPSNISQVVAELQLTIADLIASKRFLPAWMVMPRDNKLRREANKLGEEMRDPGNPLFEALFHAAGLEQLFMCSIDHHQAMMHLPNAPYSDKTNKSSHGPVNRRGNLIEGALAFLWKKMGDEQSRRSSRK